MSNGEAYQITRSQTCAHAETCGRVCVKGDAVTSNTKVSKDGGARYRGGRRAPEGRKKERWGGGIVREECAVRLIETNTGRLTETTRKTR